MDNVEIPIPTFDSPVFRVIVITEDVTYRDEKSFQDVTETRYIAHTLEWSLCVSAKTLAESLARIECLLLSQRLLMDQFPSSIFPGDAAENWQRLRNSGDEFVPMYRAARCPVVYRGDIDMRQTKLRAFTKKPA